uniref:PHD-type domain-containing protein n=1 Tax=Spongospora subterranea TaxID=70186 RepID=A0A0H5REZ5_9EUKA|eukprot:CRZ12112.1 hypothetical protein [Spongospora subterranea]
MFSQSSMLNFCTYLGDVTIEHVDYYYFKRSTDMFEKYGQGNPVPVDIVSCPECKGPAKKGISLTCELCHRDYHEKCVDETARPAKSNATWHCQSCANSTLAFVSGSHNSTGYDRPRRNEQLPKSLSKSLRWSVPFEPLDPGDMFIFNVKTVHCANKNTSGLFRASTDTRISLTPIGRQSWPDLISKSQL